MSGPGNLGPEAALTAALVATLQGAPAVAALVDQRVHADPPRKPTYPCVIAGRQESRPFLADADGLEHLVTLTCASKFGGPEEARAITAAVRAALHNAAPPVEGRRLVIPDFVQLEGPFLVAALEYAGEHDGEAAFALSLASAGAVTFTAI